MGRLAVPPSDDGIPVTWHDLTATRQEREERCRGAQFAENNEIYIYTYVCMYIYIMIYNDI